MKNELNQLLKTWKSHIPTICYGLKAIPIGITVEQKDTCGSNMVAQQGIPEEKKYKKSTRHDMFLVQLIKFFAIRQKYISRQLYNIWKFQFPLGQKMSGKDSIFCSVGLQNKINQDCSRKRSTKFGFCNSYIYKHTFVTAWTPKILGDQHTTYIATSK